MVAAACALSPANALLAHAQATAVRPGTCLTTDANAVTVVIDFQGLGGEALQYCVSDLAAGTTGVAALQATGVGVQGTAASGLSFVCRIDSKPGAGQALTLPNGQSYVETCANTPPSTAYWSYWHASQGGQWAYSSQGASVRAVEFGGYEGWSFALGASFGHAPAPRVAPAAWVTPPTPTPTAAPTATTIAPAPQPTATATQPTTTQPTATQQPMTTPATTPTAVPTTPVTSPPPIPPSSAGSGFPWGTAIGIGLIVAVAAASGIAVWSRRRGRPPR